MKIIMHCFLLITFLGAIVSLLGCSLITPPAQPIPFEKDQYGCDRPTQGVVLNKNELETAGLKIGDFALGNLEYKSHPELIEIMTKASGDSLVIEYLVCVAIKRGDVKNTDQRDYLRRMLHFMTSKPTSEEIMRWQKENQFPKLMGKLEISGTRNLDGI
jgi:hypothetical protein